MRLPGIVAAALLLTGPAWAGEVLPAPPAQYFNDYASLVSADDAARLEAQLRSFDAETSNQVVVAIFPELPSPSLEDFTIRTAQAWRAGQKKLDNGVVLFVFVKDRKIRLEVGYGLEGALPDALAKRIVDDEIATHFRAGDPAGGLSAGIDAILKATRGEYKPSGRDRSAPPILVQVLLLIVVLVVLLALLLALMGPTLYSGGGYRTYRRGGWRSGGWGGGSGGGWGGGSSGGGFSGGGGGFGGGGASGSW